MKKILFSLLTFCLPFLAIGQITINEVDPNQAGTDMAEFVELMGTPGASADGFVLVLFNGSNDASYNAIDLDGLVFDANGLLVINLPSNGLQNGADAVAVYMGDATDFPNNTSVTTTNLIDAIVYGTNDGDDTGLLTGLGETIQYNDDDATSIQADGTGGYVSATPTEGQPNDVTPADCPDGSNIGDPCDDGVATTVNDTVQSDCTCAGTDAGLIDCGAVAWEAVQVVNNSQTDVWTAIIGGWSMNGFVGGGVMEQVDQWLVYGPIDVSAASALFLNFDAVEGFDGTDLNVVWTDTYTGCPADATWTNAATLTATGAVSADLSAAAGTAVFIAIEYSDDGANGYSGWDLTNFTLLADVCPTAGTPMISMCTMTFDCATEMVNFGDACDDMDATTENDVIQADCTCAGVAFDCPTEMANIGDTCDDMDATTTDDVIQSDCTCAGTVPIPADIYISELSFNPCAEQGDDGDCEYIIITNDGAADADISGYMISNGFTYTFPAGTTIASGGTLSLGISPDCMGLDAFDISGGWSGSMSNSNDETIEILDATGTLVSAVMYNGTFGDGDCNANCFDAIGTASDCPSLLYDPTFDCPTEMVNFGDTCDDMDAATTDDVIQADCTCAGTVPVAADLYISELSFNPCEDQGNDGDCEYIIITNDGATDADISDYMISNGFSYTFPAGTTIAAGATLSLGISPNCAGLDAFDVSGGWSGSMSNSNDETIEILDATGTLVSAVIYNGAFGDGDCNANCFDAVGTASDCPSSLYEQTFDCPTEMVNFGDTCDDMDAATTNDVIQMDCTCAGESPTFDCPTEMANFGDACDDMDANTTNDFIQSDCTCAGTIPGLAAELYISELSFNPCAEQGSDGDCEYVIITNAGATDIDISNYTLINGITFTFPVGTVIPSGGTLSVGASADCMGLNDFDLVAFSGGFSNSSDETVEISDAECVIVSSVTYNGAFGDGNCNANCFDAMGTASECPSSLYDPTFDCPTEMVNFGDTCDDMDPATVGDAIQADCSCAGTIPVASDIYISELSFNPCPAQGSDTDCEYLIITNAGTTDIDISDYMLANGITFTFPTGTIIPAGGTLSVGASMDCVELDDFDVVGFSGGFSNATDEIIEILDAAGVLVSSVMYNGEFGDGDCNANCFDSLGMPSDCPSSLYNPVFDCTTEMVNFGDTCDDMDANTTNDMIQMDCTCAGTIPTFDCPTEMVNFGDTCDDTDANTINDIIQTDCTCAGTLIADIYISELSFNPCTEQGSNCDCEYLIVTNAGAADADISDYELANGITFTFPTGTIIPAGGTLSVGATENCAGLDAFDLTGFSGLFNNMTNETIEILTPEGTSVNPVTYDTTFGNGNCSANCFDAMGTVSECPSSLYDSSAGCSLTAGSCAACPAGDNNIAIDLTTGTVFNEGQEFCAAFDCINAIDPIPTYDPTTNTGTWTLPAGVVNAFAVGGINNLSLPNVINGGCLTADINVISGTTPFLIEFRIENGTGAPGNGGQALVFDVMADDTGMCSMGGDFSTGTAANGFTFTAGTTYSVVIALADFSGNPVPSDIIIEVSNIALNICAPNVMGCTDVNACNFDADATVDDGSCVLATGCDVCDGAGGVTDNPEVGETCDDEDPATVNDVVLADCSCQGVLPDEGCTDPIATNYDPAALVDNGTCLYLCDENDLLDVSTAFGFDGGTGLSYGLPGGMGLLADANNDFGGFGWSVNTAGLTNDDFCISVDYIVTGDAAAFPITLEFRIENNGCGFDGCPWLDFNVVVNGPGTYTLGGVVSDGNVGPNGPFDSAGMNPTIIAAIANFSGTPLGGDVNVMFSNLCVSTDCGVEPPVDCAPSIIQFPANPTGN